MSDGVGLAVWVIAWTLAASIICVWCARSSDGAGGSGLELSYVAQLAQLHWFGGAVYLLPWHWNLDEGVVGTGFRVSTYAVMAFGIGCVIIGPAISRVLWSAPVVARRDGIEGWLPKLYVLVGFVAYFGLLPVLGDVPTLSAFLGTGLNLAVAGFVLGCWRACLREGQARLAGWVLAAFCLPFVTLLLKGFLGYGFMALVVVLAFIASVVRSRPRVAVVAVLAVYVGLSFYVTYMRDRSEIRGVVWQGEPVASRLEEMFTMLSTFEWFDPYEAAHLQRIEERLNQNVLVGAAVQYLELGFEKFEDGRTIVDAGISLVPRALWPSKPVVAGSMNLVERYTGIYVAEGTSVGIGQVLEFYINFGAPGVVLGFIVLGVILGLISIGARRRLAAGDSEGFVLWFLPGLAMLQAGGSLVEVLSSAGAAVAMAVIVNRSIVRWTRWLGVVVTAVLSIPSARVRGGVSG